MLYSTYPSVRKPRQRQRVGGADPVPGGAFTRGVVRLGAFSVRNTAEASLNRNYSLDFVRLLEVGSFVT